MSARDNARSMPSRGSNPRLVAALETLSRRSSLFVLLIGFVVLAGWALHLEILKTGLPGRVATNPMTALGLMLAAAALCIQHEAWKGSSDSILRRRAIRAVALVIVALGVITLAGYVLGQNLGLDAMLFRGRLGDNRIAPNTGLNFVFIGVALWFLDWSPQSRRAPAQLAALFPIGIAGVSLLGYVYGVPAMYGMGGYIPMALPTAVSIFALALGILCARPDRGFVSVITRNDAGGVLARRILPVAVLIPVVLGWLRLWWHRTQFFSEEQGLAIVVVITIFAFAVFIAITARSLSRADRVRRVSERHSAAQYKTTRVLLESTTLMEAMPQILQAVCESLDWVMGADGASIRRRKCCAARKCGWLPVAPCRSWSTSTVGSPLGAVSGFQAGSGAPAGPRGSSTSFGIRTSHGRRRLRPEVCTARSVSPSSAPAASWG